MNKENLLKQLEKVRENDFYDNEDLKNLLIEKFFPSSTSVLTLDLSNITSAFYGLLLNNIGEKIGFESIDDISKKTFYDLGQAKSKQCLGKYENIPKDSRTFLIVLISAIYNASPEYSFKILEFNKNRTVFELNGIDRYLRILNNLSISQYITFPTLIPFMDGIKDYYKINSSMDVDFEIINKDMNEVKCIYKFELN